MPTPQEIQRTYYAATADKYDSMHGSHIEHERALRIMSAFIQLHEYGSLLDVGTGTGRALTFLRERLPGLALRGIEPTAALLAAAEAKGVPSEILDLGHGERLPYPSDSFDVVCEFGVLHHVPEPFLVIEEMLRVARRAVFLSDANRFGQGGLLAGVTKLALWKLHLWRLADLIKTRGKGYTYSAGDGIAYSYSVYDSLDVISGWADEVILIGTQASRPPNWLHPLLTSNSVLLGAIRGPN